MHPDPIATPGDDLRALAAQRADLGEWPTDPRAVPDALLDIFTVAQRLQAEADALAAQASARLRDLGLVAKACRICGSLYLVKVKVRPRLYCRVQCELDSQTLAFRQRESELSATVTAGG